MSKMLSSERSKEIWKWLENNIKCNDSGLGVVEFDKMHIFTECCLGDIREAFIIRLKCTLQDGPWGRERTACRFVDGEPQCYTLK